MMVDGRWWMRGSMEWDRMRQNVPMDLCSFITNNIIVRTEPIKMVAISCARLNASVARAQCAPRAAPAFRAAPLRPSRMVRVYLMCPIRADRLEWGAVVDSWHLDFAASITGQRFRGLCPAVLLLVRGILV